MVPRVRWSFVVLGSSYDEILNAPHVEDSDDEQDVDRADDFESKYNFRFEEVRAPTAVDRSIDRVHAAGTIAFSSTV